MRGWRALAGVAVLAGSVAAQADDDAVDRFVRAEMAKEKIPGVAVAIVRAGEPVKLQGYGEANLEHHVPVTPETLFQSGSVGKQFTAALVMTLVEEGKLGLDEPIARYLPDTPRGFRAITVRHLLTHTSGIPDYTEGTVDLRRDYTEDQLRKMAFGLTLEFAPGSRWSYSNTGYVMLGILVRQVSGRFYGDLLRERIFEPLGMRTARIISEADIVPHRAAGYQLVKGEIRNQDWVAPKLNTTADGSLYLSLQDMVAWERGLRAGAVLKPESWKEVFTPVRLRSGKPYPYGFGWDLGQQDGQAVVEHSGSWQGFESHIARWLGPALTVVVFANLAEADPEGLAHGVAAAFDPQLAPAEPPAGDEGPAEVARRVRSLLLAARDARLSPKELAYVRAGFFPETARAYAQLLQGTAEPRRLQLVQSRELGDDRVWVYDVTYPDRVLRLRLAIAPDGRVAQFSLRSR